MNLKEEKKIKEEDKGIEEDIFIYKISLDSGFLKLYVKGYINPSYGKEKVILECRSRVRTSDRAVSLEIEKDMIHVDKKGIFKSIFKLPLTSIEPINNKINTVWDFYFLADKKTRIKYFEKTNNIFNYIDKDYIPYATSKQTFSLISLHKNSLEFNSNNKKIMLVVSDFSLKSDTVKEIIELANSLSILKFNVTLVCLDLKAKPNHFSISKNVNIDYVSTPFYRADNSEINFNTNNDTLSNEYKKYLKDYIMKIDVDWLYIPVFGKPIYEIIIENKPNKTKLIVGDYSKKRETQYLEIFNNKNINIELLSKITNSEFLFNSFNDIDLFHITNKEAAKNINKIASNLNIISSDINENTTIWIKLLGGIKR